MKLSSWLPLTFFTGPGAKSCARDIEALMWPPEQTATTKGTLNLCFSHLKLHPPFELLLSLQHLRKLLQWPYLNCHIFEIGNYSIFEARRIFFILLDINQQVLKTKTLCVGQKWQHNYKKTPCLRERLQNQMQSESLWSAPTVTFGFQWREV